MKYLLIIILTLSITCCSSTKKLPIKKIDTKTLKTVSNPNPITQIDTLLNTTKIESSQIKLPPKPPKELETKTINHNRWNKLLQQNVSESGQVNYQKIKANKQELDIYIDYLSHNSPNNNWSNQEKLAYWINAYNALTIDLILRNQPLKSIKDIKNPWDQRLWKLGNKWYTLNDIEHSILRKMNEPRIHFAIVCASYSCPKLLNKAFTASNLETELTKATKTFLKDNNRNTITANSIELSRIFKWFSKDFKSNGTLINFINLYSETKISNRAKISYKDYNWNLNN